MPTRSPAPHGVLQLNVTELLPWARGIARGVRGDYGFRRGSAEEEDLEGVALVALVELANRYDELQLPAGGNLVDAFMGYADVEIRSRCRRHAVTLRNGGTFRTTSSADVRTMRVVSLPVTARWCSTSTAGSTYPRRTRQRGRWWTSWPRGWSTTSSSEAETPHSYGRGVATGGSRRLKMAAKPHRR